MPRPRTCYCSRCGDLGESVSKDTWRHHTLLDLLPEPKTYMQYEARLQKEVDNLEEEAAEYYARIADHIRSTETEKELVSKGVQTEQRSGEADKLGSPPASKKRKTDDGEQSESKPDDAQATDGKTASTSSSLVTSEARRAALPTRKCMSIVPVDDSP